MKGYYYITPLVLQTLIWAPTKLFFKLFYKIEIKGEENIKECQSLGILNCYLANFLGKFLIKFKVSFLGQRFLGHSKDGIG